MTVSELKIKFTIAYPGIFELNDVAVSNKKTKSYEIMANVKANLASNYKSDGAPSKTYYFIETLNILTQKTIEVEIDKLVLPSKPCKVNSDLKTFTTSFIRILPKNFRYTLQLLHH
jgi:hypothetical protein